MAVIGYSDNSFDFYKRQLDEQDVPSIPLDVESVQRVDSREIDWKGGSSESSWATDDEVF